MLVECLKGCEQEIHDVSDISFSVFVFAPGRINHDDGFYLQIRLKSEKRYTQDRIVMTLYSLTSTCRYFAGQVRTLSLFCFLGK